jgi:hypothetical protein
LLHGVAGEPAHRLFLGGLQLGEQRAHLVAVHLQRLEVALEGGPSAGGLGSLEAPLQAVDAFRPDV